MNLLKLIKNKYLIFTMTLMVGFSLIHIISYVWAGTAPTNAPGSEGDPIITKSYVDEIMKDLNAKTSETNEKINTNNTDINGLKEKTVLIDSVNAALKEKLSLIESVNNELQKKITLIESVNNEQLNFKAIELKLGEQLIAGESTEFILRGGKSKAIASKAGGLSDITAGNGLDIMTGADVPLNHLILVSRNDGRGIKVTSDKAWILVKGKYTLK